MTATLSYLPSKYQAETVLVFLIEGVEVAYTNHSSPSTIKALWSATGHGAMAASWKSGLVLDGSIKTQITPYDSKIEAEALTIRCLDPDDTLLALTQRQAYTSAKRTTLRSTIDADDTTIPVQSTTGFASSGTIWIGSERITYTSVTGGATPSFNGCTRATLALFDRSSGADFGYPHGVGQTIFDGASAADVWDSPRIWFNRRCGLYLLHNEAGTYTDGAAPLCIWAGRIKTMREAGGGYLAFKTVNVLELLDTAVFSDQFDGELEPGLWMPARSPETVVARIRVNTRQVPSGTGRDSGEVDLLATTDDAYDDGFLSHQELASIVDDELSTLDAGGATIYGDAWELKLIQTDDGPRYRFRTTLTTTSSVLYAVVVSLGQRVWAMLGWYAAGDSVLSVNERETLVARAMAPDDTNAYYDLIAPGPPLLYYKQLQPREKLSLVNTRGTFIAQTFTGPLAVGSDIATQALFQIGDYVVGVNSSYQVSTPVIGQLSSMIGVEGASGIISIMIPDDGGNQPLRVKQVYVEQGDRADIMLKLLLSTGTSGGYNDATYDTYTTPGFGVGVPYSLVETASWKGLRGSLFTLVLDKPRKFSEILERVLQVAGAHVVFRRGKIAIARPGEPAFGLGDYSLTEGNKGEPEADIYADGDDSIINQVKIRYNRQLNGSFKGEIPIRALRSIDDFGEKRAATIEAEGVYDGILGLPSGLDEAIETAAAALAYFSRPLRIVERPYDFSLLGISAGDTANLTSEYVPDPTTGTRGVASWPCWVLTTDWDPQTGKGRLKVCFLPEFAAVQRTLWSPTAEVSSASIGGGKLIINTVAHRYTPSTATATDASYFPAGYKVAIRTISETSGVGTTHVGTIESISGADQLTLTTDPTAGAGLNTTNSKWIVEFDDYSTAISAQQNGFAWICASLTRLILTGGSTWYRTWLPGPGWEVEAVDYTTLHRRPLNVADDDGEPHSVGWFIDAMNGLNCEYAYGTRQQLVNEVLGTSRTVASSSRTWIYGPVWVPLYSYARTLSIRAFASCSGGGTGTIRFVASQAPPRGTSATAYTFIEGETFYGEVTTTSASLAFTAVGSLANPNRTTDYTGRMHGMWLTVLGSSSAGTLTVKGLEVYDGVL